MEFKNVCLSVFYFFTEIILPLRTLFRRRLSWCLSLVLTLSQTFCVNNHSPFLIGKNKFRHFLQIFVQIENMMKFFFVFLVRISVTELRLLFYCRFACSGSNRYYYFHYYCLSYYELKRTDRRTDCRNGRSSMKRLLLICTGRKMN